MFQFTLKRLLQKAKDGEARAREELIVKHRDYIARVSSRICKRFLNWENDDELSIALLAFNEAINSYDFNQNASFSSFAYTVMQRRLTDYFRRNPAKYELLLAASPDQAENNMLLLLEQQSHNSYQEGLQQERMAATIELFQQHLSKYSITLEDLVQCSPKHRDSREKLFQVAMTILHNEDLLGCLRNTRKLPAKELIDITGLSTRVLEKGRKYIIATVLLFTEPDLLALQRFTKPFSPETER
ncbi:RNA polymerase sigma-I factor [Desulforamulus aeronauticus]|uniref:RNA polymerase sigma factor SigI n=1 Tax=Desulforamulus aeronauticus DSM 10349 TaxID=1121421 RepID=A0A1M6UMT2_9FIRM|nr:RNA polymerase sigma-I factor [Desulforamulus aeronauticus]SHK70478.1 RNA polymerase sigma factor [Desulforamulus aeronauticus DSM 10349]